MRELMARSAFPDIYPALTAEIILNERFALKSPGLLFAT